MQPLPTTGHLAWGEALAIPILTYLGSLRSLVEESSHPSIPSTLSWSSSSGGYPFSNFKPLSWSVARGPISGESVTGPLSSLTEKRFGT